MPNPSRTLAVIGAGPKGLAVAVKAKVFAEVGIPTDQVILIEKNGVAAHWSGEFGYTNGEMKLGTSPEKDVVFPLETDTGNDALNAKVRERLLHFTWTSFLVQTRGYSDWVDRGRPAPCHRLWATYLRWVSEQLAPEVRIVHAEVLEIDFSSDSTRWEISLRGPNGDRSVMHSDRLMLTGPGHTRADFLENEAGTVPEGIYNLESFWRALKAGEFPLSGRLAIIGAGENAASALVALSQGSSGMRVDVISPRGFVSTRAESYYENQVYSQPERNNWGNLEISDRTDFIERTDLGVFSVDAMRVLNDEVRHRIIPGRAISLKREAGELSLKVEYRQKTSSLSYDRVILATGFDSVASLKALFSDRAITAIEERISASVTYEALSARIQPDLSVFGLEPRLHLPMLAGIMQGPGFSNLSCLGRLSDRVMGGV